MIARDFHRASSAGVRRSAGSWRIRSHAARAGIALLLAAALVAAGYFLNPIATTRIPAQQIQSARKGGMRGPAGPGRRRDTSVSADDGRGGRVVRGMAARGDRIVPRGDRLSGRFAIDDGHSLAWRAPTMWLPRNTAWHAHMLAPARIAKVQAAFALRDTVTASRRRKFARLRLAAAPRPPAPAYAALPQEAPLPSVRPEGEADRATHAAGGALPDERAEAVPLPSPRPRIAAREEGPLASPQPESRPAPTRDDAAAPDLAELPARAPLPPARPQRRVAGSQRQASQASTQLAYASPDAPVENKRGILSKLFGAGTRRHLPGPGSGIAVYDIKAATVHLPNGERLEAHSGLGPMQDDPRYADEKNRGPTPPNVYNLVMRERRFHGVEAVRLLPADGKKKYGRDGLLAHTYMYAGGGSRSQSNGCVAFEDYDRFLKAFKRGRITRMIVVPSLQALPTYMAKL